MKSRFKENHSQIIGEGLIRTKKKMLKAIILLEMVPHSFFSKEVKIKSYW
jgi:hypothetical protein